MTTTSKGPNEKTVKYASDPPSLVSLSSENPWNVSFNKPQNPFSDSFSFAIYNPLYTGVVKKLCQIFFCFHQTGWIVFLYSKTAIPTWQFYLINACLSYSKKCYKLIVV